MNLDTNNGGGDGDTCENVDTRGHFLFDVVFGTAKVPHSFYLASWNCVLYRFV